jgi:protein SCO1/2
VRRPLRAALATLVLVAGALATCAVAPRFTGITLPGQPAWDFTLTDQHGAPFHLAAQRGRVVVLFFGYTHCPDVCPATMAQLARAYRTLTPAERARVTVAFVTIDPVRDTRAVLTRWVALFEPHFVALTGSAGELIPVYYAYHVDHTRIPASSGTGYLLEHTSAIFLIDPDGRLRVLHGWQDTAGAIAADVRALLAGAPATGDEPVTRATAASRSSR